MLSHSGGIMLNQRRRGCLVQFGSWQYHLDVRQRPVFEVALGVKSAVSNWMMLCYVTVCCKS